MRKIFLRWEIDFYCNYLNQPIKPFIDAAASAAVITDDLRINEFRKGLGLEAHPDERGEKFVWEEYEPREGDDRIPAEVIEAYKLKVRASNKARESGKLSDEELSAIHPKLFR